MAECLVFDKEENCFQLGLGDPFQSLRYCVFILKTANLYNILFMVNTKSFIQFPVNYLSNPVMYISVFSLNELAAFVQITNSFTFIFVQSLYILLQFSLVHNIVPVKLIWITRNGDLVSCFKCSLRSHMYSMPSAIPFVSSRFPPHFLSCLLYFGLYCININKLITNLFCDLISENLQDQEIQQKYSINR